MWSFALDGGPAPLDDVSPVDGRSPGSTADALEQRAAAEALSLSAKALRMTLQKIGGLLAAGSALAAKDWGVEARVRNGSGLQSSSMEEFMPSGKTTELRRRLRSSQSTTF
ncbi:PH domain-containing protein [Durusdinium trenchii]|uniref:PH domain-containing protein n=1 Tax=Durusdinium trenchii TaxID=1381693 RepID=A0ABP0STV6_9DINO